MDRDNNNKRRREEEEDEEDEEHVLAMAAASAAIATAQAVVAALEYIERQPYRREGLRGRSETVHSSQMDAEPPHEFYNAPLYHEDDNTSPVHVDPDAHPASSEVPDASEAPSAHTLSSGRFRGRPRVEPSTFKPPTKKKRSGINKIHSSLKQMASALDKLAASSRSSLEMNLARSVNEAMVELYGTDTVNRMKAIRYLVEHKDIALIILDSPKEERRTLIDDCLGSANADG